MLNYNDYAKEKLPCNYFVSKYHTAVSADTALKE